MVGINRKKPFFTKTWHPPSELDLKSRVRRVCVSLVTENGILSVEATCALQNPSENFPLVLEQLKATEVAVQKCKKQLISIAAEKGLIE